jgi:nicotinamidase-related amidase
MKINSKRAFLLVIDVQERLLPAMHEPDRVVDNCRILIQAAGRLGVPVLASEQYPQGLGPTVAALAAHLPAAGAHAKLHFSCANDRELRTAMAALGRSQAVLCGIESHVCVSQTALDLVALGYSCFVAADATSSRNPDHVGPALERMRGNGVEVVVTEQVVFECLGQAGTKLFKDVSALVR